MNICARKGCELEFVKKTHNQKYCDDECCRLATNTRLKEKYHSGRARLKGEVRLCTKCEHTKLSRYNDSNICAACRGKSELEANREVLNMLLTA